MSSTAVEIEARGSAAAAAAAAAAVSARGAGGALPSIGASARAVPSISGLARAHARTRWWVEALTIVWLCWVYDAITNLAPLRVHAALSNAQGLLGVEQWLHIDPERALDRWLAGHQTLGLLVSDYYDNAHFVVTLGLLGWLWWRRADVYRPLRNSLVLVNVLGFIVFWRFPVAPPRMLPGFVDVVASTHAIGSWHTGALASTANQLAAMPSLHIAWAVWCTLALWTISTRRSVRTAAVVYPCLTALAVLATGNHYTLDILGGLVAIVASVLLVRFGERRRGWRASAPGGGRTPRAVRGACHKLVTKSKTR